MCPKAWEPPPKGVPIFSKRIGMIMVSILLIEGNNHSLGPKIQAQAQETIVITSTIKRIMGIEFPKNHIDTRFLTILSEFGLTPTTTLKSLDNPA